MIKLGINLWGNTKEPDGLSLDLQFAADKTLTARKGPTPVFSRGSSGTFVNANGLIVGKTTATSPSITPSSQAIGSQVSVIVSSGFVAGWVVGQPISLIVDTDGQDDPDATELWLLGNITSIAGGILTFEVTSRTAQAGSAFWWTLGYRGPRFDHDPVGKTNLLTRSQEFNLSPWGTNNAMTVTPDATIAPDGTLTADAINFDTNSTSRIIYLTGSAVVHTFSVWLRADTNRTCIIATAANLSANIDVVANVTTTWQRFSVVASNWSSSTSSFNVRIASNATGTSGTIFAWGAQLEAGSFPTSYIPTTTAPVTIRDCKGLLIEESRTNLTTQSGNPASWTGGFTNNGATTAPDGLSNGVAALVGILTITTPATGAITGLHVASVFVKRNNTDWARIQAAQGSFAHAVNFWVNLATGAAGTLSVAVGTPTSLSAQVTPFGNSWYRISITASYPATASLTLSVISATADASVTRVAGSIYEVWGAQLEAGAFSTSYIPTTTASAARSADVCSISGDAFTGMVKTGEGSVVVHGDSWQGTSPTFCQFSDNTSGVNGTFYFRRNSSTGALEHFDGAAGDSIVAVSPSFPVKFGVARNQEGAVRLRTFYNGTNGPGISAFSATTAQTRMLIGNSSSNTPLNGCIRSIKHFKKRLSDVKMRALTAP
jgi:hypothetical protein